MTDLELTETAAKWLGCGYKKEEHLTGMGHYIRLNGISKWFDPLHDMNDLMLKVVPKLLEENWLLSINITKDEDKVWAEIVNVMTFSVVKEAVFPTDFPRAVLKLVKEIYDGRK